MNSAQEGFKSKETTYRIIKDNYRSPHPVIKYFKQCLIGTYWAIPLKKDTPPVDKLAICVPWDRNLCLLDCATDVSIQKNYRKCAEICNRIQKPRELDTCHWVVYPYMNGIAH